MEREKLESILKGLELGFLLWNHDSQNAEVHVGVDALFTETAWEPVMTQRHPANRSWFLNSVH
jgi:hypothetical protein